MTESSAVPELLQSPHLAYRKRLAEGVLSYQRCRSCRTSVFPPRVVCPHCGATGLDTLDSAGKGTVYSATSVSQREAAGYTVVLVDLEEGFRMMSTVLGPGAEDVAIGQGVRLVVEQGDAPRATFVIGVE